MGRIIWEPMPGKIVVQALKEERLGNLWLPESADRSRSMGIVIAIGGDESEGEDYPLAVGDRVLFSRNSGVKATVDREEVLIFRTTEILTKIRWEDEDEGT